MQLLKIEIVQRLRFFYTPMPSKTTQKYDIGFLKKRKKKTLPL